MIRGNANLLVDGNVPPWVDENTLVLPGTEICRAVGGKETSIVAVESSTLDEMLARLERVCGMVHQRLQRLCGDTVVDGEKRYLRIFVEYTRI